MSRRELRGGVILLLLFFLGAAGGCSQGSGQEPEAVSVAEQDGGDGQKNAAETDWPEDVENIDVMEDGRSVAQRLEDASIAARARKALVDEAGLRAFNLQTEAERGRLTLRGDVVTQVQRRRAEEIAARVQGVREVVNEVVAAEMPEQPAIAEAARPEEPAAAPQEAARPDSRATSQERTPQDSPAPVTPPTVEQQPEAQSTAGTFHTVRSGESLWIISRQYGVTVDDIRRLNNLRTNNLRPGDRLRVK
jgi:LysM repeat protein